MAEETVRGLIEALTEAAAGTLNGLDSPIDLGICNGQDLQYIDEIDVSSLTLVNRQTGTPAPGSGRVLIRGHWHPDKAPGELRHGIASDADEEWRRLNERGQSSTPQ
jgi:hypothetical protein